MDHIPMNRFLGHPLQCGVIEPQLLTQIQHLLGSQVMNDTLHTTLVSIRPCRERMAGSKKAETNTPDMNVHGYILVEVLVI
jgi:hypothetical protein